MPGVACARIHQLSLPRGAAANCSSRQAGEAGLSVDLNDKMLDQLMRQERAVLFGEIHFRNALAWTGNRTPADLAASGPTDSARGQQRDDPSGAVGDHIVTSRLGIHRAGAINMRGWNVAVSSPGLRHVASQFVLASPGESLLSRTGRCAAISMVAAGTGRSGRAPAGSGTALIQHQ